MMGAALSLDSRAAFTQQLPLGPSSWQIYGCEGLAVITQLELAIWGSINLYESAHNLSAPRSPTARLGDKGKQARD